VSRSRDLVGWVDDFFSANVGLAIRLKGGSAQVAAEISIVSLSKMVTEANCHHAT
jgi:hypothetical protein